MSSIQHQTDSVEALRCLGSWDKNVKIGKIICVMSRSLTRTAMKLLLRKSCSIRSLKINTDRASLQITEED